jgi:hypothetical protein
MLIEFSFLLFDYTIPFHFMACLSGVGVGDLLWKLGLTVWKLWEERNGYLMRFNEICLFCITIQRVGNK